MISSALNIVPSFYAPPMARSNTVLDDIVYIPSKPYPRPLAAGLTAARAYIWVGFKNRVFAIQASNDESVTVPIGRQEIHGLNTATFRPAIGNASGVAPKRRVYTGVGG